jgi:hypothetical protein
MESRLSRSPFHEFFFHDRISAIKEPFTQTLLFHDWILAIKEPFTRTFVFHDGTLSIKETFTRTFLFHDGTLAIKEPFTRIFSFSRWNSGYQGAFHTNFSFSRWNSGYQGAFHTNFFSRWNSQNARFRGRLFSYIYHKEYLHRIRLVKTLPLDLEPPLQGKECGPSYSNATRKGKTDFWSRNHL